MIEPLRFSRLKLMGKSPAHFAAYQEQPTRAMTVGTAAHSLLLGGAPVVGYVAGKARRGAEFEKFKADAGPGCVILGASDYELATGMVGAVRANKDAMRLLDGEREKTMLWQNMCFQCRGTPDVRAGRFITDLKTGETSDPRDFKWKVLKYAYHAQLAWYADGANALPDSSIDECYLVAVEAKAPFVVTVFRVTADALDMGRRIYRKWLEELKVCQDSGHFPGYAQAVVDLELPNQEDGLIFGSEEDLTDADEAS